jgi:predicted exporter
MARWSFLVALALAAAVAAQRSDLSTDITHFMPDSGRAGLAAVSRQLATSTLSRTMTLTIGVRGGEDTAANEQAIASAADQLTAVLAAHPEVDWIRDGRREDFGQEVWDLYFPRRFYFASARPEVEVAALSADAELARVAGKAKRELGSPTGMLIKRTVERDPLGLFAGIVDRMTAASADADGLELRLGRLWSADGHAVIFVGTRSSAFASGPQGELLNAIDQAFAEIARGDEFDLFYERGGANRFAVEAERSIRRDVYRIAVLSVVGVVTVFISFFPSPWRLLLVLLPALAGIVGATLVCIVVFGRIDGLTLAFGSALIGVAIDYPIHLLNHQGLVTAHVGASVRRLAGTLSLGAATTIASFAGLALTSFPGFREIGVFAMAGIAVALTVTLLVVPLFPSATAAAPQRARTTARALDRFVLRVRSAGRALLLVPLAAVLFAGFALPRLSWEDDLSKLNRIDAELEAEEDRVRGRVTSFETGRFVVAVGDDIDGVLQINEQLQSELRKLVATGALGGILSISDFIWSEPLQRRNVEALLAIPDLPERVADAYELAGFRSGVTDAFAKDLEEQATATAAAPPLRMPDLVGTGIGDLVAGLIVDVDATFGQIAAITQLREIGDYDALQDAVAGVPSAYILDQRDLANQLYAEFRWQTLRQIAIGSVLVFVVLLVRYRSWRPALAAFLPSALVALLVPSLAAVVGTPLNLLHVVSLVMVMGMGVDYGIFLVDGSREHDAVGATTLSLLLSCLTTVMVFGVLALSSNPALSAIGWTTGLGILLSFSFAPIALVVLEEGS